MTTKPFRLRRAVLVTAALALASTVATTSPALAKKAAKTTRKKAAATTKKKVTGLTTTTVAQLSGDPIVIQSTLNIVGGQSSFGPRAAGFEAGIRAQNARGGISGRPLKLVFCDGHSDPNQEMTCLRNGLKEGPVVLANHILRGGEQARPLLDQADLSEVGGIASFYTADRRRLMSAPGQIGSDASLLMYRQLGIKKVIVVQSTRVPNLPPSAAQLAARSKAGVTVLDPLLVDVTITDWAPTAQALKARTPEAVIIGGIGGPAELKLVEAMAIIGFKPKLVAARSNFQPQDLEYLKPMLDGNYFLTQGNLPVDYTKNAEIKRLNDELDAAQRAGVAFTEKPRVNDHVVGWLNAQAIIKVLQGMKGEITAKTFTEALFAAKNIDFGGVAPKWTPSKDVDPGTIQRQTNDAFYIMQQKGTKFVLYSDELYCGDIDGC